jgi:uncharacterized protein YbjT (DUF2867 family)
MTSSPVHVIGASGRSGAALCHALLGRQVRVVAVVRSPERLAPAGLGRDTAGLSTRVADLGDADALAAALAGAASVVSMAHARHAAAVLHASPAGARHVFLGSTRTHTRWPDAHGLGVREGEAAFLRSGHDGVMLHPTMIYGAQGEDNVQRLAALLRRLPAPGGRPLVPLPGGGRALVQPIHQSDVTACVLAALARAWDGPHALTIAGPQAVSYAGFVVAVARAAGLGSPRVVAVPAAPLIAATLLTRLPFLPRVRAAELRRLLEDKAFDIAPMHAVLGVAPIPLAQGLAATFALPAGLTPT